RPARRHVIVAAWCPECGVATYTTSTSGSSASACQPRYARGTANSVANRSAASWLREPTATTSASGISFRSCAKWRAMVPVDKIPHLMVMVAHSRLDPWTRTSSTRYARRSAGTGAGWPACGPTTWPHCRWPNSCAGTPRSTRPRSMTSSWATPTVAVRTTATWAGWPLRSHVRAAAAWDKGLHDDYVLPVEGVTRDESIRADTSKERLAALKPAFSPQGTVTAGNASPINDGAIAVLVGSPSTVDRLDGAMPLGRVVASATVGVEPHLYSTAPVPAIRKALDRAGLSTSDIAVWELNEAFAAMVL